MTGAPDGSWTPLAKPRGQGREGGGPPLVVCAATHGELGHGWNPAPFPALRQTSREGVAVVELVTGPGPVNAAMALGIYLCGHQAAGVIDVGIAGALPGAGLSPGALAVAAEEVDADTGAEDPGAPGLVVPISVPLIHPPPDRPGRYPADPGLTALLLGAAGLKRPVTFVTSATVSGDPARAFALATRHGAAVENMEGAALARVAREFNVPFAALRGISNLAGERDLGRWTIDEAVERYLRALCRAIALWGDGGGEKMKS